MELQNRLPPVRVEDMVLHLPRFDANHASNREQTFDSVNTAEEDRCRTGTRREYKLWMSCI